MSNILLMTLELINPGKSSRIGATWNITFVLPLVFCHVRSVMVEH